MTDKNDQDANKSAIAKPQETSWILNFETYFYSADCILIIKKLIIHFRSLSLFYSPFPLPAGA